MLSDHDTLTILSMRWKLRHKHGEKTIRSLLLHRLSGVTGDAVETLGHVWRLPIRPQSCITTSCSSCSPSIHHLQMTMQRAIVAVYEDALCFSLHAHDNGHSEAHIASRSRVRYARIRNCTTCSTPLQRCSCTRMVAPTATAAIHMRNIDIAQI